MLGTAEMLSFDLKRIKNLNPGHLKFIPFRYFSI